MFENLTNKFEEIFSSLKKSPSLDETQVDEGLRGIRQALLEADVSLEVAKDFIEKVKPTALGQEIIRSTSPGGYGCQSCLRRTCKFVGRG